MIKKRVRAELKLVRGWEEESAHVHRQEIGAVTASDSDDLEDACVRNTNREDSATKVALNITEVVGGGEVVR